MQRRRKRKCKVKECIAKNYLLTNISIPTTLSYGPELSRKVIFYMNDQKTHCKINIAIRTFNHLRNKFRQADNV